ncbi:hypothetical protein HK105_202786 [Polyrhizophydium stewartii]|uniref:G-patch domain-containing protein n=1 Tax=Polyrhizophydium stewartii TaxID=2732419 RepID=A0ABR4NDA8_9FUNG
MDVDVPAGDDARPSGGDAARSTGTTGSPAAAPAPNGEAATPDRRLGYGLVLPTRHNGIARDANDADGPDAGASEPDAAGAGRPDGGAADDPAPTLEEEAVQALRDQASGKEALSRPKIGDLPILVQNAVPGLNAFDNDVDRYRHDVAMRPDVSTLEDYEQVPIDQFGEAMLRGMGWSDGKPVGKNQGAMVVPVVPKPRPHLLGLGATPAPVVESKSKRPPRPGDNRKPESSRTPSRPAPPADAYRDSARSVKERPAKGYDVVPGARVFIKAGSSRGKKGFVLEVKEKTSGRVVKIELEDTKDIARVWFGDVSVIEPAPASALHSIALAPKGSARAPFPSPSSAAPAAAVATVYETPAPPTPVVAKPKRSWLQPRLRVRIVSKSLRKGRLFNSRAIIDDVVRIGECMLRIEGSGEIVDEVYDRQLETCLPNVGRPVKVVDHADRQLIGMTGELLEKDSRKERAVVRLDHDDSIETFTFDEVCDFVE